MIDWTGLAIGVLGGAGGLAGISRFVTRARVYSGWGSWSVVQMGSPKQRATVEQTLDQEQLPLHVVEVVWCNVGRRDAKDLVVDVEVPGTFRDFEMSPDKRDVAAAWNARRLPDGVLRIEQDRLRPKTECTLIVGYGAPLKEGKPRVRVYANERQVNPRPGWSGELAGQALLVLLLILALVLHQSGLPAVAVYGIPVVLLMLFFILTWPELKLSSKYQVDNRKPRR
jgi:hypothetical protein